MGQSGARWCWALWRCRSFCQSMSCRDASVHSKAQTMSQGLEFISGGPALALRMASLAHGPRWPFGCSISCQDHESRDGKTPFRDCKFEDHNRSARRSAFIVMPCHAVCP